MTSDMPTYVSRRVLFIAAYESCRPPRARSVLIIETQRKVVEKMLASTTGSCGRSGFRQLAKMTVLSRFSSSESPTTYRMKRIYTTPDGGSKFGSVTIPYDAHSGDIGSLSKLFPASGVLFRVTPGSYNFDWHNAPREQFIVNLKGAVDITTSDGKQLRIGQGEVFYVQDLDGQGHFSQAVDGETRQSLFIPAPSEALSGMMSDDWVEAE